MPIYPISFCIPESVIIKDIDLIIQNKTCLVAPYKPGDTYSFNHPEPYYNMYKNACFAHTCKKGGWDCYRHLEILANGCLPIFKDLETIPASIMTFYPKELMKEAIELYQLCKKEYFSKYINDYRLLVTKAITHVKTHLTTVAMAQYVLDTIPKKDIQSVLFLGNFTYIDFQRCLLLHGFKSLFKEKCVDYVRIAHLYNSYPVNELYKYGAGFGFAGTLPAEYDTLCNRSNIEERIKNKEFDLIIYGSIHRGLPFIDSVSSNYNPSEIVFIDGEDCNPLIVGKYHTCILQDCLKCKGHLFVREWNGQS